MLDDSVELDLFLAGVGPIIVIIVVWSAAPAAPAAIVIVIIVVRSAASSAPAAIIFKWSLGRIIFVLLHRLIFLHHFTAHLEVVLVDRGLIVEHLSHGFGEVLIGPAGSYLVFEQVDHGLAQNDDTLDVLEKIKTGQVWNTRE